MARVFRNPIALGVLAVLLLVLIGSTSRSSRDVQAVIRPLGEPQRIDQSVPAGANRSATPSLAESARVPFIEQISWIDKRILSIPDGAQQVLSTNQQAPPGRRPTRGNPESSIPADVHLGAQRGASLRPAQADPRLGSEERARQARIRGHCSARSAGQMMENNQKRLEPRRRPVRRGDRRRADQARRPPEGTPLESAFQRMRTARQQEARSIQAQGAKQAQIIRAEADAEAANVYAEAFGKDPDFFDFYRACSPTNRPSSTTDSRPGAGPLSIILSRRTIILTKFQGRADRAAPPFNSRSAAPD
jgi:membrane protease subunit HflC